MKLNRVWLQRVCGVRFGRRIHGKLYIVHVYAELTWAVMQLRYHIKSELARRGPYRSPAPDIAAVLPDLPARAAAHLAVQSHMIQRGVSDAAHG